MKKNEIFFEDNRRKYIRVDTVFPIEFQIISDDQTAPVSEIKEGFTQNIGKGGICISTKVVKNSQFLEFTANTTKLKLIINIPSDKEPLEAFATVEWIEKFSGPLVDTYTFGISYDFINESRYEKILNYVSWLKRKPLILKSLVFISLGIVLGLLFFILNSKKFTDAAKGLLVSKEMLQKFESDMGQKKEELDILQKDLRELQELRKSEEKASLELEKKRIELEESLKEVENQKESLYSELDALKNEYSSVKKEAPSEEETQPEKPSDNSSQTPSEKEQIKISKEVPEEILKLEQDNYNSFRELILQERVQSLEIYCSSHQSSIYYPAALFALAEIQYKNRNITFAQANYNRLVEKFPESKYGLYAGHRLDQIKSYYNYDYATLKEIGEKFNLSGLYDYRNIEPYLKK